MHLVTAGGGAGAGDDEVGFQPAVLFFRAFVLALEDRLVGADDSWAGGYGCDYTEHHDVKYSCVTVCRGSLRKGQVGGSSD